ncbi:Elongation factor 4 [Frankliniella fusca]|uniref:Elongation factor 4 n=1 Tax=Frankliniella fusca TaxID=407009 RepID=A0AAE1HLF4_9NEOP|nr:Elongation factor 4 [Frankliniella fusca]
MDPEKFFRDVFGYRIADFEVSGLSALTERNVTDKIKSLYDVYDKLRKSRVRGGPAFEQQLEGFRNSLAEVMWIGNLSKGPPTVAEKRKAEHLACVEPTKRRRVQHKQESDFEVPEAETESVLMAKVALSLDRGKLSSRSAFRTVGAVLLAASDSQKSGLSYCNIYRLRRETRATQAAKIRDETLKINGKTIEIPLGKKVLKNDAVPTIFQKYPSYKNVKAPPKRKPPPEKRTTNSNIKKRKTVQIPEEEPFVESECLDETKSQQEDNDNDFICDKPLGLLDTLYESPGIVERPNSNWHIQKGPNFVSYVCISDAIQIDRYVKIIQGASEQQIFLLQKQIMQSHKVTTLENFQDLLKQVDSFRACPGTGYDSCERSDTCSTYLAPSGSKTRLPPRCFDCAKQRAHIAKAISRQLNWKFTRTRKNLEKSQEKAKLKRKNS